MKALLLVVYALGAPIGVGCLLFLLWRLEEGLLGSPPSLPLPEGDRPNRTTIDDPVSATSPSLLYVGAIRDPQPPAGLLPYFGSDPQPVDSNGYPQYLPAEPDLGFNGYQPQPALSDCPQPGGSESDGQRQNGG
jgi:hypothetical protein